MVFWSGRECSLVHEKWTHLTLSSYIWLLMSVTVRWMRNIKRLETRSPMIMLLVLRSVGSANAKKGNAVRLGDQEVLRALASF